MPQVIHLILLLLMSLVASLPTGCDSSTGDTTPGNKPTVTAPKEISPVDLGRQLYTANCAQCHLPSGEGQPGLYPPLNASEWVNGEPARLARIILKGVNGPIQSRDMTYVGAMPNWDTRFPDRQIAALMTYIRQAWSNTASPVGPEIAAAARKATEGRRSPFTAEELLEITGPDLAPESDPSSTAKPGT